MRFIISSLFIFLFASRVEAQYSNSWIDHQKQYLKISIAEDGIYELNSRELLAAGVTVEELNSLNPHLMHHGKEVPLSWDDNSVLKFYAERNKGELDDLLYLPGSQKPHKDFALFQDQSIYFLYWSEEPILNYTTEKFENNEAVSSSIVTRERIFSYRNQYSFNNSIGLLPALQQSYYEDGEGWTGVFLSMDSSAHFSYELPDFSVVENEKIKAIIRLNGRSPNAHAIRYEINGIMQPDTLLVPPFGVKEKTILIDPNLVLNKAITITFQGIKSTTYDWFSLSEVSFSYTTNARIPLGEITVSSDRKVPVTCENCSVLKYKNRYEIKPLEAVAGQIALKSNSIYRVVPISLKPSHIEKVGFAELNRNINYFIISHKSLAEGAEAYKSYRESDEGGAYAVEISYMSDLYNQFSFGERSPLAIKNYLEWATNENFEGKHVLLLGRGVSFPDVLKTWADRDLVPTIGYPGSDVLLSSGLDKTYDSEVQGISTGRLNVTKNSEILQYLEKVKELESQNIAADWKKRFAHLSGGKTISEIESLKNTLGQIKPDAEMGLLGAGVKTFVKRTTDEVEPIDISEEVNEGLGMIAFAGHGSANVLDLNIGYCSPLENGYNNKGKYPVMYFNGCGVGNVFYRYDPLTTDWLLTPNKGAIAVFANSFWSYQIGTQYFLSEFYDKLFTDSESAGLTLGEVHKEVNQVLSNLKFNPFILSNIHQLVLQGDPAIKYFPIEKPDYEITENSIFITSSNTAQPIGQSNLKSIGVIVKNNGRYEKDIEASIEIQVESAQSQVVKRFDFNSFARVDTIYTEVDLREITKISITINGADEYTLINNTASLEIGNWDEVAASTSFPKQVIPDRVGPVVLVKVAGNLLKNDQYIASSSKIEVLLSDGNLLTPVIDKLKAEIKRCETCDFEPILIQNVEMLTNYQLKFDISADLEPGEYELSLIGYDEEQNASQRYLRKFKVASSQEKTKFSIYPNPASGFTSAEINIVAPNSPESLEVKLFDLSGQLIQSHKLTPTVGDVTQILSLEGLSAGSYFVKCSLSWIGEKEELSYKLIVLD